MLWTFHRNREIASLLTCISLVNNLSESFVPTATRPSLNQDCSHTFVSFHHGNNVIRSKTCLDAKPKKKKKAGSAGAGGFGKVQAVSTKPKSKVVDDYASFPRLEPGVIETLVPSTPELMDGSDITMEIYDRLDQIYDFPYFNVDNEPDVYAVKDDTNNNDESTTSSPMSMNDLLSVDDGDDNSSSSGFGDLLGAPATGDFDDLIAAAASGKSTTTTVKTTKEVTDKKVASKKLNLYNLNPFSKVKVLHIDPLVITVEDFFTDEECDRYVNLCANPKKHTSNENMPMMLSSKTVGKDAISKSQRSSTTWFHHFKNVPELMAKASRLLGLDSIDRWEEPQTVRYRQTEKYTWHLDALAPSDDLDQKGGQRTATLLVYLTDMGDDAGGATMFRDLGGGADGDFLKVQPKKGSALLFFPSAGGIPNVPFDIRTLHAGEAVSDDAKSDKWIAQLWLRKNDLYRATGPPGNSHAAASDAINQYCDLHHDTKA